VRASTTETTHTGFPTPRSSSTGATTSRRRASIADTVLLVSAVTYTQRPSAAPRLRPLPSINL